MGNNKDRTTEQHVTATVALAGRQHTQISTSGDGRGGAGSYIQIAWTAVLITCYDKAAVATYARLWNESAAAIYARRLPIERTPIEPLEGASRVTVAVTAHSRHRAELTPLPDRLQVQIGSVRWDVLDQAAYAQQVDLWDRITLVANLLLPPHYLPTA